MKNGDGGPFPWRKAGLFPLAPFLWQLCLRAAKCDDGRLGSGHCSLLSQELTQEQLEQAIEDALNQQGQSSPQQGGQQLNVQLQEMQGQAGEQGQNEMSEQMREQMSKIAEDIVQNFEQQMSQVRGQGHVFACACTCVDDVLHVVAGWILWRGEWHPTVLGFRSS